MDGHVNLKEKEDYYGGGNQQHQHQQHQQQQQQQHAGSRIRRRDDYDREMDEPMEKRRRGDAFSSGRLGPVVIGPRFNRPPRDSVEEDDYAPTAQGGRRVCANN
jgi:hypothetical protein